jgi:hypothetical protein
MALDPVIPARPSAAARKSAVFARALRHLRRRGSSVCLKEWQWRWIRS